MIGSRSVISSGEPCSLTKRRLPDGSAFAMIIFSLPQWFWTSAVARESFSPASFSQSFDVTGVDISMRQIELARRNVPAARFICGDVATLTRVLESFDAVVASCSLFHIPRAEHQTLFRTIFEG
jgi:hypothetical protein